ncbi:HAMP domain-containing sensor histidine kinase [Crassaminicella thermophila]|uniref:HAMP domain-containing sensor histidine kinase n=1 Tax=Crassaminicella thermophila TaxID=2599308 RepID=UPI001E4266FF|nr:ATP-binding protein [Crassaminicella thermophila]
MISLFINEVIYKNYIDEKKSSLLLQGNIIADRVIAYHIDINRSRNGIDHIIKKYSKEIKSRVMIINKKGIVVHDAYEALKDRKLGHWEIKEALKGKSIANEYNLKEYGRTMYVTVPIVLNDQVHGVVFISSSLEDIYRKIQNIMKSYMILSVLCVGITGFISFVFAHVIANPIEKLTDSIKKMYNGNLEQKVEIIGNDELTNLAGAFNMMSTKLSQVDKQRKEFVANVSHELRTPLSAMKLLSESLLHQEKVDPKTYREFFSDIASEVDRLDRIIESLLALVDIDKGKLELDYQVTYVNYLLEKLIRPLKPLADKKQIDIDFVNLEKVQIQLDRIKIQQALTNIINNAIKYTPEGGKIKISLYTEHDEVIIKIQDNGIGIPEESLPYIFERFYRVDKARARKTGGTGLGLAITKQIIELHQGKIEVISQLNKGTTFYIYLPQNIGLNG